MTPAADDALNCPLCGYDLRGLPANRCPECGHAFDPDELRRATAEQSGWFFEHARRRLPIAFLKTATLSLAPWTFWHRVAAVDRIAWRRLVWWAAAWTLTAVSIACLEFARAVMVRVQVASLFGQKWRGRLVDWQIVIDEAWRYGKLGPSLAVLPIIAAIWPALAFASLHAFGRTLGRAGIRRGHLWRCTLYAMPSALATYAVGVLLADHLDAYRIGLLSLAVAEAIESFGLHHTLALWLLLAATCSTVHLAISHRRYLRVPHAIAQAVLASLAAWIALVVIVVVAIAAF